ncbi:hypothetical protein EDC17_10442 [Sphingobacterium alimentarium]|uniref:Uncharacterized protein n=1 Tax=Sphingobacterium alimentarium TaxID=797292 RepID=A0A4R3VN87_9SPHI|nr:hypothetical protein [Sphingobacterium alimentarium]TCV08464.1 hypothetical protein EDC17_10442 [Sphingobacterium alimentarium]
MKVKILPIIYFIIFLTLSSCSSDEEDRPNAKYKYIPERSLVFFQHNSVFSTLDTRIRPFDIYVDLKTELTYTSKFSIIPIALAESPVIFNWINWKNTSISINKSFSYKKQTIEANSDLLSVDGNAVVLHDTENKATFNNIFFTNARFNKGLTKFTVSGELEDGQKFKFEKEVYLDL